MKKIILGMVLLGLVAGGLVWSQESGNPMEPEKEYKLAKAYAYRSEQLLLSEADFFSCFILEKEPDRSLFITDIRTFSDDSDFSTQDMVRDDQTVFLNQGENSGLKKGQKYLISGISEEKILDHFLIVRKGIGEIINVYAETAELKITKLYNPVEKGDFLAEQQAVTEISRLKVAYENTIVPEDADAVKIHLPEHVTFGRTIVGPEQFVAIEMGRDKLSTGDLLVFFRRLKPHLPPLIMGTGVALYVGDTLSTVKTIDVTYPLVAGCEAAVLPEPEIIEGSGEGPVPVVKRISDIGEAAVEEMLTVEIPFEIDSYSIDESLAGQFVRIKEFLEGKSEYSVVLKGYCCSIGDEVKNLELSQKRVEAVKKILLEQLSVPESQLEAAYYGEKDAPYDNSSEAERRKNRLVMVVVVGK